MGAVIVASWLVEAKQSVIENMAPVLTRLFTPLFTVVLLVFLATMVWTGSPIDVEREVLIAFDLLLALVVGLVLYSASARDPQAPPDLFDRAAAAAGRERARRGRRGAGGHRRAHLGVRLHAEPRRGARREPDPAGQPRVVGVALRAFLRGGRPFAALERWQTAYLPVYAAWAAFVVIVFPPLFAYA